MLPLVMEASDVSGLLRLSFHYLQRVYVYIEVECLVTGIHLYPLTKCQRSIIKLTIQVL